MDKSRFTRPCRTFLLGLSGGTALLAGALGAQAAVSQSPLSLTIGVPPNLLLTLDDSGSMRWAFAPDEKSGKSATRAAKSNAFNPMYYNPAVTYRAPKIFNSSGDEVQLSTSYSEAYVNGYNTARGSLDLRDGYKVSWTYDLEGGVGSSYGYSSTRTRLAENPVEDFSCSPARITSNNSTAKCTIAGNVEVTVRRTGSNSCTASAPGFEAGTCSGSSGYFTASWARKGVPAYYYVYDKNNSSCSNSTSDDDCYTLRFVSSTSGVARANDPEAGRDERQNFATWYSFYRNRALATMSAAALAFYDVSPTMRLSWQGLGRCTTFTGSDSNCRSNKFQDYNKNHRANLYSWLTRIDFDQSTYLPAAMRRAGDFYMTETPWLKYPDGSGTNTTKNTYACRPSYHIMMTDGLWNSTTGSPSNYRPDHNSFTLPDGKSYDKQKPFHDEKTGTLADLAMHYWATDLRPTLEDKVPVYTPYTNNDADKQYWDPRNDPATWQHMVTYTMGLGLTEALNQEGLEWKGGTFSGAGYKALVDGTQTWPPASSGSDNNVYDLWHAAINSRGEFFSVDTPDAMVQAFEDILSRIAERKSTAARPAITSGLIESDDDSSTIKSYYYQTSYASDENWAGDLKRRCRGCDPLDKDKLVDDWSAREEIPAHTSRNIKIPGSGTSGLQDFTWSNAGNAGTWGTLAYWLSDDPELAGWANDGKGADRLAYLRGNRSLEGSDGFRQRTSVLGDLYASSPVTVSGPRYLRTFADRLEGHAASDSNSYTSFASSIGTRHSRVYVGGNDGMLHAFNSETGAEEFAFIPSALFPKLNKLTGKNYTHEFYVDGSPVVADVYDDDGSKWRTILVGNLRAGGKALFALDVTTPGQEKLLWEFDSEDVVGDGDPVKPGYSFPRPTLARLHNGKWAVVTGNGYEGENTSDGRAALYIIDAISGELIKSLEVQGQTGVANGLSSPTLADYDADGVADYAYAGDLQGNLWRFDLLGANADPERDPSEGSIYGDKNSSTVDFKVAYDDKPMFKATSTKDSARQPITAAPNLIRHPSGSGYLIVFGTGKFFEDGDKDGVKTHAQSVYAIWDRQTRAETTAELTVKRSQLVKQTITSSVTGTDGASSTPARIVSNTPIEWITLDEQGEELTSKTRYGWYLDLQAGSTLDGEMLVENMATLGQTLFFQTLIPNDDPCADGASNWTYALNPYTGGRTNHHAFEIHYLNGEIKEVVSAIKQDGEGGITIAQRPDRNFELCTGQECVKVYPDPASIGRQTWRKVTEE